MWKHWSTGLCSAVPSSKTTSVSRGALEHGGANVHFQCPGQSAVLDPVWDAKVALEDEDSVWLFMAGLTEGREVYFQISLKCDFLGTFHQEI